MGALNMDGYVRVTTNLSEPVIGRYDGEDYEFIPGEPSDVPVPVAAHIFGFGVVEKTAVLARLGWAQNSGQTKEAMEKLKKIRFEDIVLTANAVHETDGPASGDMVPRLNEPGNVSPLVNAGGMEGAVYSAPEVPDEPDVV